jgi:hypothetical protein
MAGMFKIMLTCAGYVCDKDVLNNGNTVDALVIE